MSKRERSKAVRKAQPTLWWCERCHSSGLADLHTLPVYDAVYALEAAHDEHELALAQACTFQLGKVRVTPLPDPPSEAPTP